MGTAAKQEVPKIIALVSSLFAEFAGGAKASTVAWTGFGTILATTIP
ncbi:MAG: hypothetical protein LUC37_02975 [Prevotella sp.]|nr:hypothetical protein [Prevotella sp.]